MVIPEGKPKTFKQKNAIEVLAIFSKKLSKKDKINNVGLVAIFFKQCELCTTVSTICFCVLLSLGKLTPEIFEIK